MQNPTLPTKKHYAILDGLRGVAAIMVVAFHIMEAHATSRFYRIINQSHWYFFLFTNCAK